MNRQLSLDDLLRLRARSQRLTNDADSGPSEAAEVVSQVAGLQAQEEAAAALALRARRRGTQNCDLEHALGTERSIVRTWVMRGTLHLVATEDLGWLIPLFAPRFIAAGRSRLRELELDEDTVNRAVEIIRRALEANGPLTRSELARMLESGGIDPGGQRAVHLLRRAALAGHIACGPRQQGQETFVLLSEIPGYHPQDRGADGLVELVRRYLGAFGPASPGDFAAWSGLSAREAQGAWRDLASELIDVNWPGGRGWLPANAAQLLSSTAPATPSVRLLGRFDGYLLGYSSRKLAVPSDYARRVHPGGGIIRPTLLVNGRVLGTWRTIHRSGRVEIELQPFVPLEEAILPGLEAEASSLSSFLGTPAKLEVLLTA